VEPARTSHTAHRLGRPVDLQGDRLRFFDVACLGGRAVIDGVLAILGDGEGSFVELPLAPVEAVLSLGDAAAALVARVQRDLDRRNVPTVISVGRSRVERGGSGWRRLVRYLLYLDVPEEDVVRNIQIKPSLRKPASGWRAAASPTRNFLGRRSTTQCCRATRLRESQRIVAASLCPGCRLGEG
jgi:hypothetical protein